MPKDQVKPHVSYLKSIHACGEAVAYAKQHPDMESAWLNCQRPDWMLWLLDKAGYKDDTQMRLYACWCARHTPLGDGRTTWDLLTDPRSRAVIEVAERFALGQATKDELTAAYAAARAAYAASAAYAAAHVAHAAAAAAYAARAAAHAAYAAHAADAARAARAAAHAAQADQLRLMVPWPVVAQLLEPK